MRIPFNELEEKYFKIIKLYRGISELRFAQEEPSKEELEKQLTTQKKATITKYEKKLKKTKLEKTRQEIRKKISALKPKYPDPIELPQTITYSGYVLFVNGKLFINPKRSELRKFESETYSKFGNHFDEYYISNINSYDKYLEREASNEEVCLGEYKLNVAEYNKLIDIETQHNSADQEKVVSKIANEYLNSIQVIKEEFRNWFELNGYPIPGDSGTAEVKNVKTTEPENKTEHTKKDKTENSKKPKKKKEDVEWIKWLESRESLKLFLSELKHNLFIIGDYEIDDIIKDHFSIQEEIPSQAIPTDVKKIRWQPARWILVCLIQRCMSHEYGLIYDINEIDKLLSRHFSDKNGEPISPPGFAQAIYLEKKVYKDPCSKKMFEIILNKVKEQAESDKQKEEEKRE